MSDDCWSDKRTAPIIRAAVQRMRGMWAGLPDLSDDVEQAALIATHKAYPTFNSAKGAYSTWVNRLTFNTANTMVRGARRAAARQKDERASAGIVWRDEGTADAEVEGGVEDWLGEAYHLAKTRGRLYEVGGRGRKGFTPAQRVALGAMRERLNLSARAAARLIRSNPHLQSLLELRRVPSRKLFERLSGTKLQNRLRLITSRRAQPPRRARNVNLVKDRERAAQMAKVGKWDTTPSEAANKLGVSLSTLSRWRRKRLHLDHFELAGVVLYAGHDIDALIDRCTVRHVPGTVAGTINPRDPERPNAA